MRSGDRGRRPQGERTMKEIEGKVHEHRGLTPTRVKGEEGGGGRDRERRPLDIRQGTYNRYAIESQIRKTFT